MAKVGVISLGIMGASDGGAKVCATAAEVARATNVTRSQHVETVRFGESGVAKGPSSRRRG